MEAVLGVLVVAAGGLLMGSGAWPFKLMKKYQFEHWWFVGMLVGLVVMPWAITLLGCPHALQSLGNVPARRDPVGQPVQHRLGHRQRAVRHLLRADRRGVDRRHPGRAGRVGGCHHADDLQGFGPFQGRRRRDCRLPALPSASPWR